MQRLIPPRLVILLLLAMVLASRFVPIWSLPSGAARLVSVGVGAACAALGVGLAVAGSQRFAAVGTNIRTFHEPGTLVVTGPFRWSRNPMYLGFVLLLVGVAIALGSAVAMLGPLCFLLAADRWYIPFEERRMAHHFGTAYGDYRADVRRWIGANR